MTSNKRLSALAAALLVTTGSILPLVAHAQAPAPAPSAPAAAAPATPDASAPPAAAPATPAAPDASAPAAGAPSPGAAPAPGTPPDASAPAASAPGAPPVAGAPTPGAPAAGTPDATAPGATPAPAAAPASSAPPSAAAAAAPPPSTTVAVSNPYGLGALWAGGDFISRGVLMILAIMSLGSWYIMITKAWEQSRLFAAAKPARNVLASNTSVVESVHSLKPNSPFRYIGETGIAASEHHEGSLLEQIDLSTWVTMSVQRAVEAIQSRLSGGLSFLASVGSVAPFVGLFGTVWGIYHALTAIGIAGQASIDKVAGPVGEALIMTAIGLATAVPAVLGYNFLVRRNKTANERVRNFAADLHSVLLSTPKTVTTAGVSRVA